MSVFGIVKNATDAKDRTVYVELPDDSADWAPWDGTVTGIKPTASINNATPAALATDIVKVAPGVIGCIFTQAESDAFAVSDFVTVWVAAASGRRKSTTAKAKVFAEPFTGAPQNVPSEAEIADAVVAAELAQLDTYARPTTTGTLTIGTTEYTATIVNGVITALVPV